jgi:hypothetical protein
MGRFELNPLLLVRLWVGSSRAQLCLFTKSRGWHSSSGFPARKAKIKIKTPRFEKGEL